MKAIIGRKIGMTQVFLKSGALIPVTVIEVLPNIVLQKKNLDNDGYESLKIGYEDMPERLVSKPDAGQFKAANTKPKRIIKELSGDQLNTYNVGDQITADLFKAGEVVDVIGINKGKGFSGNIFRNNQKIGPKGHGSGYHRGVGSLATNGRDNNRVYPGKRMPGHEGHKQVSVLNLEVVKVDMENNAILVKGAIPGPKKGIVTIRSAVKDSKKKIPERILAVYKKAAAPVVAEVEAVQETVSAEAESK